MTSAKMAKSAKTEEVGLAKKIRLAKETKSPKIEEVGWAKKVRLAKAESEHVSADLEKSPIKVKMM